MTNRRGFLRGAVRLSVLGTMSAAAGWLVLRRRDAPQRSCINQSICRGCPVFTGCGLPPALSYREAKRSPAIKGDSTGRTG